MKVAVVGAGAVGARAARQLASVAEVDRVIVYDRRPERAERVVATLDGSAVQADDAVVDEADAVVLALPARQHLGLTLPYLRRNVPVISTSDAVDDVEALLDLDSEARERGVTVVVGAGFTPGFTCVLARHAASNFDRVDEVHVAKAGTGGPACAVQHHRALAAMAVDWRDGGWVRRRGGSGRELCWFPDPVGPQDCYRAGLPDALLLVPAFPDVVRVTARLAANRRDRLTAHLPMLRRPHPEGGPGAVRVEVRGQRASSRDTKVLGAMDRPAVAAGAVAALSAVWAVSGKLHRPGAAGLAELVDPVPFLSELARGGIKAAVFEEQ